MVVIAILTFCYVPLSSEQVRADLFSCSYGGTIYFEVNFKFLGAYIPQPVSTRASLNPNDSLSA